MKCIYRLENTIQQYSWGSKTAMRELFGIPNPDGRPMAEIWMGAHPKAPSVLLWKDGRITLERFIAEHPVEALGDRALREFGPKLPFLFKILSAGEPLSIQAHPNRDQAAAGYDREERLGIPIEAPERNYRDRNHKPEIICALTPFSAVRGFRPPEEISRNFSACPDEPLRQAASKAVVKDGGLRTFFTVVQRMSKDRVNAAAEGMLESRSLPARPEYLWLEKLLRLYPGDPGVFAPLYLNLVELAPGQAMYLPAGELHAYLEGTGVELMASSDNVLRGGLTVKHVDVDELLSVLTFSSGTPELLSPVPSSCGQQGRVRAAAYGAVSREFSLSVLTVNGETADTGELTFAGVCGGRPGILFCAEGEVALTDSSDGEVFRLRTGESVFIGACSPGYRLEGRGRLYAAAVPQ